MMAPKTYNNYINPNVCAYKEQVPNQHTKNFFGLLEEADKLMWTSCSKYTNLHIVARLLNLSSKVNMPTACYDHVLSIIK